MLLDALTQSHWEKLPSELQESAGRLVQPLECPEASCQAILPLLSLGAVSDFRACVCFIFPAFRHSRVVHLALAASFAKRFSGKLFTFPIGERFFYECHFGNKSSPY